MLFWAWFLDYTKDSNGLLKWWPWLSIHISFLFIGSLRISHTVLYHTHPSPSSSEIPSFLTHPASVSSPLFFKPLTIMCADYPLKVLQHGSAKAMENKSFTFFLSYAYSLPVSYEKPITWPDFERHHLRPINQMCVLIPQINSCKIINTRLR